MTMTVTTGIGISMVILPIMTGMPVTRIVSDTVVSDRSWFSYEFEVKNASRWTTESAFLLYRASR
jgi:hypothetical protein